MIDLLTVWGIPKKTITNWKSNPNSYRFSMIVVFENFDLINDYLKSTKKEIKIHDFIFKCISLIKTSSIDVYSNNAIYETKKLLETSGIEFMYVWECDEYRWSNKSVEENNIYMSSLLLSIIKIGDSKYLEGQNSKDNPCLQNKASKK